MSTEGAIRSKPQRQWLDNRWGWTAGHCVAHLLKMLYFSCSPVNVCVHANYRGVFASKWLEVHMMPTWTHPSGLTHQNFNMKTRVLCGATCVIVHLAIFGWVLVCQTHKHSIYWASIASCGKNYSSSYHSLSIKSYRLDWNVLKQSEQNFPSYCCNLHSNKCTKGTWLIELRFYVPPNTKKVILETFFSANLLA